MRCPILSEEPTTNDEIRIRKILKVERETPTISTLYFNDPRAARAEPGQYIMIWLPGHGEVPMSLSMISPPERSAVTIRERGETTRALLASRKGDRIGVRGPYGKGYRVTEGRSLLVGGGTGVASLAPLAERLAELESEIYFILGTETIRETLFLERLDHLEGTRIELIVTTEDGSLGLKGRPTDPARRLIEEKEFEMVYTCGPEMMMREIFNITEKRGVQLQASLERIIKCGIGLCGHCGIGPYLVCKDGPVFSSDQLRKIEDEFGIRTRDHTGRYTTIEQ